MDRYRFAMSRGVIDLKPILSAGPFSTQGSEIEVKFINVGNLTTGIDIPEVGFKLDLMPSGSETCRLLNIDPNKAYSLKFSFYDSSQVVWCGALSRRYFCAKEFVSRKKKILKSSLVEMLLLPKGIIPLKDFSIGAKLKEFFLRDPRDLATCHI